MYEVSKYLCAAGWRARGSVIDVEEQRFDIDRFHRWALGNLVSNTNRGIFAEWLVGQALESIGDREVREEWDECDLRYRGLKIEVKTSGLDQTWHQDRRSPPRFDIKRRTWIWDAQTGESTPHDPPIRPADLYVFCLREPIPATNPNVREPEAWKFWVVSKRTLDNQLGPQKSVGLSTLSELTAPLGWSDLRAEVDRCIKEVRS